MFKKPLLVIDVETTGLDPSHDSIIQLSACLLSRRDLGEELHFTSRIQPTTAVSDSARLIHGISDEELRDAPALPDVVRAFDAFVPHDVILCGHNVGFDVSFLRSAYERAGIQFAFDYHSLDIWSIAFFVLGAREVKLQNYSLNSLCSLFGIQRDRYHDALQDVRVSSMILRHLFKVVASAETPELEVLGQLTLENL
jgi:DNA polymerase III epsilon subunit family exonuclease